MISARDIAEFQRATAPLFPPFASPARLADIAITLTPVPAPVPQDGTLAGDSSAPQPPPAGVPLIRDEG